ncbi:hypothetical protein [Mycolicibacter algericus]|uniref:Uncharacterized protein n=2 Tax=Mycolicibacter algericus TaxID=1288388 RepID=A0A7I9Y7B2_MYCAL|nr:hypothetical protein [Mycolicibacter algericus]OQZ99069.1 hypothetical protein BST10_02445 [Mycolicibacter algericus DSM 45454]GFG84571.1 hypothetical protein MALGJ_12470 [Mycolicibacter algericus]
MTYNSDAAGAVRAKRSVGQLTDLGVKIPAAVQNKVDQLAKLEAAAPRQPSAHTLIDATIAQDQKAIDAAALAEVTFEARRTAHFAAISAAGRAVSDAIRAARHTIARDLTRLARQHAEAADAANQIDGTLEGLVQAGRFDDAATKAAGPSHAAAVERLQSWAVSHLGGPLDIPEPAEAGA